MTIDDRSGDDKFAELFDHFRESFLSRLEAACAALQTCEFRACDIEGRPLAWVWSDADFGHSGRIGTLSDAKAFANAMINQGMLFAYAKCAQDGTGDGTGTIWLTTWEAPDEGPVWPEHVPMSEAESWDGIPHEALALVGRDVSSTQHSLESGVTNWRLADDPQLVRYFERENVWAKNWVRVIDARAIVTDDHGCEFALSVWEAKFGGQNKRFAADEISNGVWAFALPKQ